MDTLKLNKYVNHMLMRAPDELESSVTDGKEKKKNPTGCDLL